MFEINFSATKNSNFLLTDKKIESKKGETKTIQKPKENKFKKAQR